MLPLALVTIASGFAGLAYEIIWTRLLAASLGTEMMAVLGVVTGFFAGLALGAFLLDGPIRRARDPRRAYAVLELAIALWALVSLWLLPASGSFLARLLGPTPPPTLLWLAGFVMPALLLAPATIAMGGTLIALERLARPMARNGRIVAGLYGANTFGATAGCAAAVLLLMPALGLAGSLVALAATNLACAVLALRLPRPTPIATQDPAPTKTSPRLTLTLAATGLLGTAFEIVAVRLAAQVLQNTVYSFALLLGAYLLGTAAGGLLWQRGRRAPTASAIAALVLAAAGAGLLTTAAALFLLPLALANEPGPGLELAIAAMLLLLPATAMGALFGCLAQAFRDRNLSLGRAIGVNALGAALGPPAATLLLIPIIGAAGAMLAASLAFLLLLPLPPRRFCVAAGPPAFCAAALLAIWPDHALIRIPPGGALLASIEGPTATASVVTDAAGARFLEINGHFRMGGTSSQRSDWREAALPLLLHPQPTRALLLGIGTGATLDGAAAFRDVSVTGVELVPEAVGLLSWFTPFGAPPHPPIVTADARRFVRAEPSDYDVIVADLFHPALDGSGSLYTEEHFAAVRERLAPGGIFVQWLPLYQLDRPSLDAIIGAFRAIYPGATAWLAHFSLQTPMLALVGAPNGLHVDPAAPTDARIRRVTGLDRPIDLLGLYLAGPDTLAELARDAPRNTDDHPFVALDAARNLHALQVAPTTLLLDLLRRSESDQSAPPGAPASLAAYRRARNAFIAAGAALPRDLDERGFMNAAIPGLLEALRISPEFDPAYLPLLAMARALLGPNNDDADHDAAIRILQAVRMVAPNRPDAAALLARLSPR